MNTRTQIILRINGCAGDDDFYEMSKEMGEFAAQTFVEEIQEERQRHPGISPQQRDRDLGKRLDKHRAQMTGLETIAETTLKATDVLDFIKKQMARQEPWRAKYAGERADLQGKRFGEGMMSYIEGYIKQQAEAICVDEVTRNRNSDEWKREQQYVYLQLVRQFIRQIVVHYEYCVALKAEELQHVNRAGTGADMSAQ